MDTSFNSFKITIPSAKANVFLRTDFWPSGLVFRRYRERFIKKQTVNNDKYNK